MPHLITAYFSSREHLDTAADMLKRHLPHVRVRRRVLEDEGFYGFPPWVSGASAAGMFQNAGFFSGATNPFPASLPPCCERCSEGYFTSVQSHASYSAAVCVEDADRPRAERLLRAAGAFGIQARHVWP